MRISDWSSDVCSSDLGLSRGEPDGRARLAAFFRRYAEIVSEDFGRCFVLTDFSEMAEDERETTRKAQLALGKAVAVMIEEGIADGSVRQCKPVVTSRDRKSPRLNSSQ